MTAEEIPLRCGVSYAGPPAVPSSARRVRWRLADAASVGPSASRPFALAVPAEPARAAAPAVTPTAPRNPRRDIADAIA
jgi:hypothetical protein